LPQEPTGKRETDRDCGEDDESHSVSGHRIDIDQRIHTDEGERVGARALMERQYSSGRVLVDPRAQNALGVLHRQAPKSDPIVRTRTARVPPLRRHARAAVFVGRTVGDVACNAEAHSTTVLLEREIAMEGAPAHYSVDRRRRE
jgi:hypothetical protein